jgi:hypothetical protein
MELIISDNTRFIVHLHTLPIATLCFRVVADKALDKVYTLTNQCCVLTSISRAIHVLLEFTCPTGDAVVNITWHRDLWDTVHCFVEVRECVGMRMPQKMMPQNALGIGRNMAAIITAIKMLLLWCVILRALTYICPPPLAEGGLFNASELSASLLCLLNSMIVGTLLKSTPRTTPMGARGPAASASAWYQTDQLLSGQWQDYTVWSIMQSTV